MNLILCEKNITASVATGFVRPELREQGRALEEEGKYVLITPVKCLRLLLLQPSQFKTKSISLYSSTTLADLDYVIILWTIIIK